MSADEALKPQSSQASSGGLREARAEFELRYFRELLDKNRWQVSLVAIDAGMERTACYHKLVRLGLLKPKEPRAKPKLVLVGRIVASELPLPPTQLVKRSPRNNGVCRAIRAKLKQIEPGTDQCFDIATGVSTAHQVAVGMGMKISAEKQAGKFIRIWRLT